MESAFTRGDTIDVTGFAAVNKSFANNTLVLGDASNNTATLHVQGAFTSDDFHFSSDGAGGTDITVANTLSWVGGSADWNTPSNWSLGAVPTSGDNPTIANAGTNTVTIGSGETASANAVTIGGSDTLAVVGTLAAQSIIDNALLSFVGNHTLATPMSVGGGVMVQSGGTLTLGSGEPVTVSSGSASFGGGGTLINKGTISDAVGGSSTVSIAPTNFVNQGTVADSGGTLAIGFDDGQVGGARGTWSNSGVITLSAQAALDLDGVVTTAGLGTINGATNVSLLGTLNNAGATLSIVGINEALGTVNLTHTGVVSGGTIVDTTSSGFTFDNGAFSGVTYQGPLVIANNGGRLIVENGLTVTGGGGTGAGTISLTQGGDAVLNFLGSQTINNATINLNGTDSFNPLTEIDIGGGNGPACSHWGRISRSTAARPIRRRISAAPRQSGFHVGGETRGRSSRRRRMARSSSVPTRGSPTQVHDPDFSGGENVEISAWFWQFRQCGEWRCLGQWPITYSRYSTPASAAR